jgi:uncharacterized protein (UPF0548 family)
MREDQLDVELGVGEVTWQRARAAIDAWAQFDIGWASIAHQGSPPRPGLEVIVQARRLGLSIAAACRVTTTHDTSDARRDRYGFTYGTLRSHPISGEELFEVWRDRATGLVGYRIYAMAAPAKWYSRLARLLVDRTRASFRSDSAAAMRREVRLAQ